MNKTTHRAETWILAAVLAAAILSLPQVSQAAAVSPQDSGATAQSQQPSSAAADAAARLNKKQFSNVKVTVDDGIATLTGTVGLYQYKKDAESRVLHAKGVTAVRNQIEVTGVSISDAQLQAKLETEITANLIGYGVVFDAISVHVENGVVTLGGHVHDYINQGSTLALVATTPGVKDMVDDISVDPTSIMDDQIRVQVARAIYGFPVFNKYAINPARPIRISVQNGHVELYGIVDSQTDKQLAFTRVNGIPGIFSVENDLEVANQPSK
jgi:hyperosmotically inducible protein